MYLLIAPQRLNFKSCCRCWLTHSKKVLDEVAREKEKEP